MNNIGLSFFSDISVYPEQVTQTAIICRITDGVGFRFYWATENLQLKTYNFKPGPDRWTVKETISHIWDLSHWIFTSLGFDSVDKPEVPDGLRNSVLEILYEIRTYFAELKDEELSGIAIRKEPFWSLINGPLEDMVSHTGAIDVLRRTAGDMPKDPKFFYGRPPE